MAAWGEKATLSVPLVYGDEVLGVLDVAESRYPRRFTADEIRLAESRSATRRLLPSTTRGCSKRPQRRNAELATLLGRGGDAELDGRPARRSRRPSHGICARPCTRPAPRSTTTTRERRSMRLVAYDSACAARTPTKAGRACTS